MPETKNVWEKSSWKQFKIVNCPLPSDALTTITSTINKKTPLVNKASIEMLLNKLASLQNDNSFILQTGDCAETFSQATLDSIQQRVDLSNSCASIISSLCNKNVIQIGRIAGQYTKPRSVDIEIINGKEVPPYKGDMINDFYGIREFTPERLLLACNAAEKSYNILKTFTNFNNYNFFTSHECLMLPFEEGYTRLIDNKYYNTSTHMLWLGNRTRFLGSAHIEYLRGIENPVGIKVGNTTSYEDLLEIINILNPKNKMGKIILINRMGIDYVKKFTPLIISAVKKANLNVLWMCDPMHGNTKKVNNFKTRFMDDIQEEISTFVNLLKEHNLYFAGMHIETTPTIVTECISCSNNPETNPVTKNNLQTNYATLCDPRLNINQSKILAKFCANLVK